MFICLATPINSNDYPLDLKTVIACVIAIRKLISNSKSVQAGFGEFSFDHIEDFMLHILMDIRGLVMIHSIHPKV